MSSRPVVVWVHPDFKKKLKVESAEAEISIIEFTRKLAHESKECDGDGLGVKRGRFNFRI